MPACLRMGLKELSRTFPNIFRSLMLCAGTSDMYIPLLVQQTPDNINSVSVTVRFYHYLLDCSNQISSHLLCLCSPLIDFPRLMTQR